MVTGGSNIEGRVAALTGWKPESWRPVSGGYTPTAGYVVESEGRRAFVKIATNSITAAALRLEAKAYGAVDSAFCPLLIGWEDESESPLLVVEDLSAGVWPPPWTAETVAKAVETIEALHRSKASLQPYAAVHGSRDLGWPSVAQDPTPFLDLGLATAEWLSMSLPVLVRAEAACLTSGDAVAHWDLRSDNMVIVNGRMKLIDWSEACLSNPRLDLGFWLPSLCFEGGPVPETILPNAPEVAAWVSGFFAARAGLPTIPHAPLVRRVQLEQLSTALPWVQRALSLPP